VSAIRRHYLAARRVYREPAPDALALTMNSFTEMAYCVSRMRKASWEAAVLHEDREAGALVRKGLTVSWTVDAARHLDDDWDDFAERALARKPLSVGFHASPIAIRKSAVARHGVLNGLRDWESWVRSCANDPRRRSV